MKAFATWLVVGMAIFAAGMAVYSLREQTQTYTKSEVANAVYSQDMHSWVDRLNACERGKRDREAIAAAFTRDAQGWTTARKRAISQGQPRFAQIYREIRDDLRATIADIKSRTGTKLDCFEQNEQPPHPAGAETFSLHRNGLRYVLVLNRP